ncbi:hypothetical protein KI387_036389, partial [Taxus chinensis]
MLSEGKVGSNSKTSSKRGQFSSGSAEDKGKCGEYKSCANGRLNLRLWVAIKQGWMVGLEYIGCLRRRNLHQMEWVCARIGKT